MGISFVNSQREVPQPNRTPSGAHKETGLGPVQPLEPFPLHLIPAVTSVVFCFTCLLQVEVTTHPSLTPFVSFVPRLILRDRRKLQGRDRSLVLLSPLTFIYCLCAVLSQTSLFLPSQLCVSMCPCVCDESLQASKLFIPIGALHWTHKIPGPYVPDPGRRTVASQANKMVTLHSLPLILTLLGQSYVFELSECNQCPLKRLGKSCSPTISDYLFCEQEEVG